MLILELGQTRAISLRTRLLPSPQTFKYTPNISSLDPWKDRLSIYPIILFPWYSNNSLNIIYVDNFYSILSVAFRKRVNIFPIQFSLKFRACYLITHAFKIQDFTQSHWEKVEIRKSSPMYTDRDISQRVSFPFGEKGRQKIGSRERDINA